MASTLKDLGFSLVGGSAQLDLDKSMLDKAVQNFGQQIQGADVTLFFYAGHGVQVGGANYLVPVNANPTREADVDFQMVDINLLMRQMDGAGSHLNMVILDACRNNPFGGRGLRSTDGGLAQIRAPEGTLVSYATQPGNVAQDGADGDSPYTKALVATIRLAGLDVFQTFNQVGLAVKRSTGGEQQPWVSSSPIDGTFYFVPPGATALPPVTPEPAKEARLTDLDTIVIKDDRSLLELSDRLYERNFDPEPFGTKNRMTAAISKFQAKAELPQSGQPTLGLLQRLRELQDLKPWGSIVYGPVSQKWGISWNHVSRKSAVEDARSKCVGGQCPLELSFYGSRCGAFAVSGNSWSLVQAQSIQKAKDAALDECNRSGKSCRIVGATCADGSEH